MLKTVRAKFVNGTIIPVEPLDVEDGAELSITVDVSPQHSDAARVRKALRATAGAWKGNHDPEELKRMLYEARLTGSREMPEL